MKPIAGVEEIPGEDLERWIVEVCQDSAAQALQRIEEQCLLSEALLHRLAMVHRADRPPFEALAQGMLVDDTDAWTQSGLMRHETKGLLELAGRTLQADGFRLHYALRRVIDVYRLTSVKVVDRINRNTVFGDDTALLLEGVGAWLEEDHVKATHVLIPQLERAVRGLMGRTAKQQTTQTGPGAAIDRSAALLGNALYRESCARVLGRDLRLHLLTLFAEDPGWNLRNRVVQGLMPAEDIHEGITNWLIHALLGIGGVPVEPRRA